MICLRVLDPVCQVLFVVYLQLLVVFQSVLNHLSNHSTSPTVLHVSSTPCDSSFLLQILFRLIIFSSKHRSRCQSYLVSFRWFFASARLAVQLYGPTKEQSSLTDDHRSSQVSLATISTTTPVMLIGPWLDTSTPSLSLASPCYWLWSGSCPPPAPSTSGPSTSSYPSLGSQSLASSSTGSRTTATAQPLTSMMLATEGFAVAGEQRRHLLSSVLACGLSRP